MPSQEFNCYYVELICLRLPKKWEERNCEYRGMTVDYIEEESVFYFDDQNIVQLKKITVVNEDWYPYHDESYAHACMKGDLLGNMVYFNKK